jgi:hypothetical protein
MESSHDLRQVGPSEKRAEKAMETGLEKSILAFAVINR